MTPPEENLYVGLQDESHSHWQNSLIWGIGLQNVMISGPGLIDGSYLDSNGNTIQVLATTDVAEVTTRTAGGTAGQANKAIALANCTNVVFRDFAIRNGGHFGILGTGVSNWTIDGIVIDTDRDAIDIDNSQNVTVRNSVFNSIQDDALVLKASFALGAFIPTRNVLLENDIVSGYEAGSVLSGAYARGQLTPITGRVKLGTEATGGFDTITVRNLIFEHCAGLALESVDGAALQNVTVTNVAMNDVFTPIFIRLGDRARTPVTGIGTSQAVSPANDVRVDNSLYILPDLAAHYGYFPASRYSPSCVQNLSVPIGGQVPAVPSNCPHVLLRIQRGLERENYGVTYREAQQAIEAEIPANFDARTRAYLLLKRHGQSLCKRSYPKCGQCPVNSSCAFVAHRYRERSTPA